MNSSGPTPADLLTIVICTYNRARELRITLDALANLSWAEVIVVDNASSDGTRELLSEYPWLTVIRSDENVGVPGFATGVAVASTPYVLLLDDDAVPYPNVMDRLVARFDSEARVGAVACHVVTPAGEVVTKDWPEHPVLFWGCGAGIRMDAVREVWPMFYPKLRLHGTELDLCIRLYSAGYRVDYDPEATIVHRFSVDNRCRRSRTRSVTYASVRFAWDYLSPRSAIRATLRALLFRRIDTGEALIGWLLGIADVLLDLGDIRKRRQVVPRSVEDAYMASVWEYQPRRFPRRPVGFPAS